MRRRNFLLAAGAAISARAHAKDQVIRAAVYGTGHAHARSKVRALLDMPEYELAGICEPRAGTRSSDPTFAQAPPLAVSEMLDDPSIELIAVEADVAWGLEYAHQAVDAGKWTHLDKSPGEDLASLQTLLRKAEAKGRIVQMGYQWRYHAAMSHAISLAKRGVLGEIYMVRATINKPISLVERAHLARFRGGMMFEMGGHMIDRIVDLLGKPKSVWGRLRHDGPAADGPAADGLADNTLAVLEFDRAMAEVYVAAMQPNGNSYRTFEILGTNGTAVVSPFSPDGSLRIDLKEAKDGASAGMSRPKVAVPDIARAHYRGSFAEMASVIREGKKPTYSSGHDLAVHEALLTVCLSG